MTVTTTAHANFRGQARAALDFYKDVFGIMAYDVQPSKAYNPGENAFYITLQGDDADEIKARWDGLADGATTILIPLAPAPFAPLYGMLTDRYGITWIIGAETPQDS